MYLQARHYFRAINSLMTNSASGPEEDDQVLFHDELPHAGQLLIILMICNKLVEDFKALVSCSGRCPLPVPQRSRLHDSVQGSSGTEQVTYGAA